MFELEINGTVYQFKFGIGFVREINKRVQKEVQDTNKKQDMGLQFAVAGLIDEDPVELVEILDLANRTESNRISRAKLDAYIEDENTNISELCGKLLDFLRHNNVTKKTANAVWEMVEAERANQ